MRQITRLILAATTVASGGVLVAAQHPSLAYASRANSSSAYVLNVSASPDRSPAQPLEGRSLSGGVYIYLSAGAPAERVAFRWDGSTTPTHVDWTSPWDLTGTAVDGSARVADTTQLTPGPHVLHAMIRTASATITVSAAVTVTETPVTTFGPSSGRPFADDSAWNAAIVQSPVIDSASPAVAVYLGSDGRAYADIYEYGDPTYNAWASTPRYRINCTEPWGICPLEQQMVPVPNGATPAPGSDGAMVVIDWPNRTAYDFWQARKTTTGWTASWGGVTNIDGDGRGGATGAGLSVLAGLIRTYEIRQGHIDHALVFATDNACRNTMRFPATKTDGVSTRSDCIPEGARVQLDPSINVEQIPGITPGEKAVARALQIYGAYARDNGGAKMAFAFENPAGEVDPYPSAGFAWDYYDMPHVPWKHLRLLRSWNGT